MITVEDDEPGVTVLHRSGPRTDEVDYEHELLEKAVRTHAARTAPGIVDGTGRPRVAGRSFYVYVSEDGRTVKVVEE